MRDHLCIYLDESGDLGFNFENNGTRRYFIITLLACHNHLAVTRFKRAVRKTLKNKLKTKESGSNELKGAHTTLATKEYFYRQVAGSKDWHLYGIVLDKHLLREKLGEQLLPNNHRIYNYLSKEVLARVDLTQITSGLLLVADKRESKKCINEFNRYLSTHIEATLPLNVKFNISHERSHENLILQAVDMFCWGVRRYYEHKEEKWLSMYEDRLTLIQVNDFLAVK